MSYIHLDFQMQTVAKQKFKITKPKVVMRMVLCQIQELMPCSMKFASLQNHIPEKQQMVTMGKLLINNISSCCLEVSDDEFLCLWKNLCSHSHSSSDWKSCLHTLVHTLVIRLGEGIHYEIKHSGNHTNQLICQMVANTTGIFLHNLSTNMMLPVSE